MRPKKTKQFKKRSRPRKNENIDLLIRQYFHEQEQGHSAKDAARIVNVPPSTMNRWIGNRYRRPDPFMLEHDGPTIDEAIRTLCLPSTLAGEVTAAYLKRVEALATFVAWLRWPRLSTSRRLGTISYVTSYMCKKHGTKYLSDLDAQSRSFFDQFLRLDILSLMCSEQALYFPTFWKFDYIESGPQDENACLAEIAWYFIAHGRDIKHSRASASVGKAIHLVNQNAFKYPWSASSFTIRKMLRDRAPAAVFIYARDQGRLDIPMEIDSKDFVQEVDNFLSEHDQIIKLFSNACWIIDNLKNILDRRAVVAFSFPQFPLEITPESFPIQPLTTKIKMALETYQSAHKTLNWLADLYDEH